MKKNRKGVSPIIGAVILIGILLVLGFSYFFWSQGLLSKFGKESSGEAACRNVKFSIGDTCYTTGSMNQMKIAFSARNEGDKKIEGFEIRLEYTGGAKTFTSSVGSEIEAADSKTMIISNPFDNPGTGNIRKIITYPTIKVESSLYTCQEKDIVKLWEEVKPCQ